MAGKVRVTGPRTEPIEVHAWPDFPTRPRAINELWRPAQVPSSPGGLTQRELSIAVGYSHAQISRLELGQRVPDLATIAARFVPALDLGKEPGVADRLLELASAPQDAPQVAGLPPFKGLQFFDEADSDLFFGREALTAKLVDQVHASLSASPAPRFLAIVGGLRQRKILFRTGGPHPCRAPGPVQGSMGNPDPHAYGPSASGPGRCAQPERGLGHLHDHAHR